MRSDRPVVASSARAVMWVSPMLALLVAPMVVPMVAPLAAQTPGRAAPPFEGVITMRAALPAPPRAAGGANAAPPMYEYLVRDGKMRVNMADGAMSLLVVPQESKAFVLMRAQATYSEIPLTGEGAPTPPAVGNVAVTRTGKFETVAGLRCEQVQVTMGAETMTLCLTSELGPYVNPMAVLQRNPSDPLQRALADGGFPLRVVRGSGAVLMEVTQVSRRRLDNAQFTVPLDYTRTELPRRR